MADDRRIDILEAEKEIDELKQRIIDIDAQKNAYDQEIEKIKNDYQKNLIATEKKHEKAIKAIYDDTDRLNEELLKLDEKTKNLSDTYKARIEDIEEQIATIKNNKFNVFNKGLNEQKEKYVKTTAEINEELETLAAKKNLYIERYNAQIIELDEYYKNLKAKEIENKQSLIDENAKNEAALIKLAEDEKTLLEIHDNKLQKIKEENEKILLDIRAKEDGIYNNLQDQLSSFKVQLENLIIQRDAKNVEVDLENKKLSESLELIRANNQEEIEKITASNEKLRQIIEQKEAELKVIAEKNTLSYNAKKKEYDDFVEKLGAEEEKTVSELQAKLDKKDEKFKDKFSSIVKGLDKTYEQEVKQFNNEIETLTNKLNTEREKINNLYKINEDRYNQKKDEYEGVVNALKEENSKLLEKAEALLSDYNNKVSQSRLNVIKLEENNKTEIENLEFEYSKKIQDLSTELAERESGIRKEIQQVNNSIKSYYEDYVTKLNDDFKRFSDDINNAKDEEEKKHKAFIEELNNRKEDLQTQIAAIDTEINLLNTDKMNEMKSFYRSEKEKATAKHKERLDNFKKQYESDLSKRKEDFNNDVAQARIDNENKINALIEDTNKNKELIQEQISQIKVDYEEHKRKLEELTEKLAQDQASQIAYYENRRNEIHDEIQKAKDAYAKEQEDYKVRVASIDTVQLETIEKIKKEHDEKIKELIRIMETEPKEELAKIKDRFEEIKSENIEERILTERQKIQEEFDEFKNSHAAIREEAQTIYKDVEMTLAVKKGEKQAAVEEFEAEVDAKKAEIAQHNARLDKDIEDIKKANDQELLNLTVQLNEQLEETRDAFKSKYEIVKREYDQEIETLKEELSQKREDYNLLIAEANNKKVILENDYKIKCDAEVAKTKVVQDEYDRLIKANDEQRAEWSRLINLRNDQIADENKNLIDKYNQAIEEKKANYQKCFDEIRGNIQDIRNKISDNEAIKIQKENELIAFKTDKEIEMENIKSQTDRVISILTEKSKMIVKQTMALEEVHKHRIDSYKLRVSELMSQLDELEKVKPTIVRKAVEDGSERLVEKTEEFKKKIQLLEKTNKEILEKLENKRNQTVEQIKFEIQELISGKNMTLKSHEEDLDRIVRTYEALLRDETSKQINLNEQLVAEKDRIAKEEAKYLLDSQNIENEYNNQVEVLAMEHEANQQKLIDEMNPQLKVLSTELLKSEEYNETLIEDIEALKVENDRFDRQILEEKNNLVNEYINKLEDINVLFNKNKEEQKARLKDVDVISEEILDLFKKH